LALSRCVRGAAGCHRAHEGNPMLKCQFRRYQFRSSNLGGAMSFRAYGVALACLLSWTLGVSAWGQSQQAAPLAPQIMDQTDSRLLRLVGYRVPTYRKPPAKKACQDKCIAQCNAAAKGPTDPNYERCLDRCAERCSNVR